MSEFQSTPLMRGATCRRAIARVEHRISIHAPHARGDIVSCFNLSSSQDFNPRPSCEGRPTASMTLAMPLVFQSTPLMRGATF